MCLFPLKAYRISFFDDITGEYVSQIKIVNDNSKDLSVPNLVTYEPLELSCGKCLECQKEYSKEWSFRIMLEAKKYAENCFVTLTYASTDGELHKRDLQLFIKRLRRHLEPLKIRYFACGEYGSKGGRPHFHLIIFGWKPKDLVFFFKDKKTYSNIYTSDFLSRVWSNGFVTVGDLTLESAKYCAKYMQKLETSYKTHKTKPFVTMSLKPGIGLYSYLEKEDIYLQTDKIYFNGSWCKIPRYYLDKSLRNCKDLTNLKNNRLLRSNIFKKSDDELEILRIRANDLLKF